MHHGKPKQIITRKSLSLKKTKNKVRKFCEKVGAYIGAQTLISSQELSINQNCLKSTTLCVYALYAKTCQFIYCPVVFLNHAFSPLFSIEELVQVGICSYYFEN